MTDESCTCEASDAAIQRGIEVAEEIFDDVFEKEEPNYDPLSVVFSLFVNSIHVLHDCGWTTQELVNEIFNHTHIPEQSSDGETLQ
jgi:uncharacterized protein YozE (UPF0346 family)